MSTALVFVDSVCMQKETQICPRFYLIVNIQAFIQDWTVLSANKIIYFHISKQIKWNNFFFFYLRVKRCDEVFEIWAKAIERDRQTSLLLHILLLHKYWKQLFFIFLYWEKIEIWMFPNNDIMDWNWDWELEDLNYSLDFVPKQFFLNNL